MKVAVTGANGFIGRHVLNELDGREVETIAVVRPSSERPFALPAGRVVDIDLHNPPLNAFELIGKPDVLIHLAWFGLPNYRSLHHFDHELPSQYRFLNDLVQSGLSNIVVAGSCFEYGNQFGPLSESIETYPNTPYGFAKNSLREQLQYMKEIYPFQLTWARLFYLFGTGQSEKSLLPQLLQAVLRGDRSFEMSGGEQLRDYLPVEKAASYLVSLALKRQDIGIVNVCSGDPISVRKLVESWVKDNELPITLNLGRYPYPDYEPMAFWGDRTKLDHILSP